MDLQPLLQQLSSRLAQALAGGSSDGAGSGNGGSSGTAEAATLSAMRQACLEGGGPAVQASMQVIAGWGAHSRPAMQSRCLSRASCSSSPPSSPCLLHPCRDTLWPF